MPVSHKHKVVFVHIPKTGGKSVSKMLGIKKGNDNYYYSGKENERTHYTVDMIPYDYYKFAFVRDPYTRIKSQHLHRMRNLAAKREPTNKSISFVEYCRVLSDRWDVIKYVNHLYKSHVIPQTDYINKEVDLYRFEDFDNECKRLCDRLEIDCKVPKINVSGETCEHTDETKEITARLYKSDFELLDYMY